MSAHLFHTALRTIFIFVVLFVATNIFADPWTKVNTGATSNLRSIVVTNGLQALAVGEGGASAQTTDGGTTWGVKHTGILDFNGIAVDSFHTVIAGDQDLVRYTKTTQWITLQTLVASNMNAVSPVIRLDSTYINIDPRGPSYSFSYSVSSQTYVTVGDDGSMEWMTFKYELVGREDNSGYWSYTPTTSFANEMNQTTWPRMNLRAIAVRNPFVYVAGDSGIFLRSSNRGASYVKFVISPNVNFTGIAAASASHLVAVGDSGNIWLSSNNAATWRTVSPAGLVHRLNAVTFVDSLTGIAVGDNATILKTTDAGNTWVLQSCNTWATLNAVSCFNGDGGIGASWMIAGDSGTVLQCFFGGSPVDAVHSIDSVSHAFGAVPIGKKATVAFTLQNNSALTYLTARCVSLSPQFTVQNNLVLDRQISGNISIVFAPVDTLPAVGKILFYTDENWIPDTLIVSGFGTGAIAKLSADSITINAVMGATQKLTINNLGNGVLTARVVFVSDTNLRVTTDSSANAHDSLQVSVQMKHTLSDSVHAFFVMQLNDYTRTNATDTIVVEMIGQPLRVRGGENLSSASVEMYPNPVRRGETINLPGGDHRAINITNAAGTTIMKANGPAFGTASLPCGTYWVGRTKIVVE